MLTLARTVLRAALRSPGLLYQPVHVGPLADGAGVWAELNMLTQTAGLGLYPDLESWTRDGGRPGVVMTSMASVPGRVIAELPRGVQLVTWGSTPDRLDPDQQAVLRDGGVVVAPDDGALPLLDVPDVSSFLVRARAEPEVPLVILVDEQDLLGTANAVRHRFEALGCRVSTGGGRLDSQTGLVVRLAGPGEAAQADRLLADAAAARAAAALVTTRAVLDDPSVQRVLEHRLGHSPVLSLESPEDAPPSDGWPALVEVLSGLPEMGPTDARATRGWTEWNPTGEIALVDLLQHNQRPRTRYDLVVWHDRGWGRLRVRDGVVLAIDLAGDPWTVERLMAVRARAGRAGLADRTTAQRDLIADRLCQIVQWPGAQVLVARLDRQDDLPALPGVQVSTLVIDLISWIDERARARRATPEGVWVAVGERLPDLGEPDSDAAVLWRYAREGGLGAGQPAASLGELGARLGILPEKVLETAEALIDGGHLRRAEGGEAGASPAGTSQAGATATVGATGGSLASGPVPPTAVAFGLVCSGLPADALGVLDRAAETGDLDVAGAHQRAQLTAIVHGPRAGLELVPVLLAPGPGAQAAVWFARRLDRALLAVRAGERPTTVWRTLTHELDERREAMATRWGVRQYAAWAEIALRAGEVAQSERAVAALQAADDPAARRVAGPLAERLAERLALRPGAAPAS